VSWHVAAILEVKAAALLVPQQKTVLLKSPANGLGEATLLPGAIRMSLDSNIASVVPMSSV
jgi:hypothetical protein